MAQLLAIISAISLLTLSQTFDTFVYIVSFRLCPLVMSKRAYKRGVSDTARYEIKSPPSHPPFLAHVSWEPSPEMVNKRGYLFDRPSL